VRPRPVPAGEDGDCYEVTDAGRKMRLTPRAAAGSCVPLDGTFGQQQNCAGAYTEVVAGKADEAACGEGGEGGGALVFAEPPTTMCLSIPRTR
jgi:hypothetical protein